MQELLTCIYNHEFFICCVQDSDKLLVHKWKTFFGLWLIFPLYLYILVYILFITILVSSYFGWILHTCLLLLFLL